MPERPNYGYAAALGAAGGYESLHKLIAARQQQEEQSQLMRLRDEQAALAQAKLDEDTKYRQSIQEQNVIEREQLQQYRNEVLKRQQDTEARQLENTQIDNWRTALDNTPGGAVLDEEGAKKAAKAGYGPMLTPMPGDHPLAPPRYTFAGGRNWQQAEKDRISREEQRALDRKSQEQQTADRLANTQAIQALTQAGQADKGWQFKEDESAEGAGWYKPGQPRRPVDTGGLLVGPAAARASKKADTLIPFISTLQTLKSVGKQYNWEGTGPTSSWQAGAQALGLHTPTEGATKVRAALGDARSLIANQRYGAALTEGEKKILDTFVATVDTQGVVTEAMIDQVLQVELNLMEDVRRGSRDLYNELRPPPAAPGMEVESVSPYLPSMTPGAAPAPSARPGGGGIKIIGIR